MENKPTMKMMREILASSRNINGLKLNSLVQIDITIDFINLYHQYPQETEKIVTNYANEIKMYSYHIKRLILRHRFNYNNPCIGYDACNTGNCSSKQPCHTACGDETTERKERYCLSPVLKINYTFRNTNSSIRKLNLRNCFRHADSNELFFVEGQFFLFQINTNTLFKSYRCTNKLCRSPDTILEISNFLYYYNNEADAIELIFCKKHSKECRACLTSLQEAFSERKIEKSYYFRLSEGSSVQKCVTVCGVDYTNDEFIGALGHFIRGSGGDLLFCVLKTWRKHQQIRSIRSSSVELTTKYIFDGIKNSICAQDQLITIILSIQLFNNLKILIYTFDVTGVSRIANNFLAVHHMKIKLFYTNVVNSGGIYINSLSEYKNRIEENVDLMFIFRKNDELNLCYKYQKKMDKQKFIYEESITVDQNSLSSRLDTYLSANSCVKHDISSILLQYLDSQLFTELQTAALRIYLKNKKKINISRIIYTLNNLIIGYRNLINRNIDKTDLHLIEKLVIDKLI
ncbi:hypothetical protein VCUG_02480 [Vavraia culicis subsp. floridensis]|uniref:Uncharacterized protein n=1 Tax=Vavraia culicis (isolate floridensis) TaxID=948595 RepID=L2GSG5_VAVCU|nr:uncharacterized protein VCUG_02480 [Vavraia culicis subsp. floridensis]ELA46025.1 hypothetical protein VCUG_02480 [Vavraia culicis subsp. floridensis]